MQLNYLERQRLFAYGTQNQQAVKSHLERWLFSLAGYSLVIAPGRSPEVIGKRRW